MPYLKRKGYRLFYQLDGEPEAPLLMLSHSLGSSLEMWNPQMEIFQKHFRVLRYDHPGHGKSDALEASLGISDLGSDALAILEGLHMGKTNFCGLSLGGMVGLWLGINAPEKLGKLAICSTAAKIERPELLRNRIKTLENNSLEAIAENVVTNWFTGGFAIKHQEVLQQAMEMLLKTKTKAYSILAETVCQLDLTAGLGTIALPVLIMYGKGDKATPPEWNLALKSKIHGSQIVDLDASHMANIEAASKFNATAISFFNNDNLN